MSWLFSRALVEEYLGENSLDGEQSALSNGNNTPQAYCAPDKMTGFSRLSRFGITYKPLTESRGEELLTLYLAAFHAKTFQPQGGGAGIDGERSGMWGEMARIIYEVRPKFVFVENSPMLTSRGLGRVLGNLASMGFDARWGVLGAADVGAKHQRDRIWIVGKQRTLAHTLSARQRGNEWQSQNEKNVSGEMAHTSDQGLWSCGRGNGGQFDRENRTGSNNQARSGTDVEFAQTGKSQDMEKEISNTASLRQQGQRQHEQFSSAKTNSDRQANIIKPIGFSDFWATEPNVGRVVDGVASRVDRLKAIGNGQVPLCAATAWRILSESL
jgi:DNA (cytosine-5)-methyltransferase 1